MKAILTSADAISDNARRRRLERPAGDRSGARAVENAVGGMRVRHIVATLWRLRRPALSRSGSFARCGLEAKGRSRAGRHLSPLDAAHHRGDPNYPIGLGLARGEPTPDQFDGRRLPVRARPPLRESKGRDETAFPMAKRIA